MTNRDLKYSLSLDRSDFDDADRLVKALLLTTKKKGPFTTLGIATEDHDNLSKSDQEYIVHWDSASGPLEGLCCWPKEVDQFNIWLNPGMDPQSTLYRVSLLHELVHGYLNRREHDAKFRDILGRSLYHYCDIVSPIKSPGFEVVAMNMRYTRARKDEAGDEYFRRLVTDKEAIERKAESELDAVAEMYERIS